MRANIFSILGALLLLIASVLLIIPSITAPVVNNMAMMTVDLPDDIQGEEVSFGSFGWCIQDGLPNGDDLCSDSRVGYDPAVVMFGIDRTDTASYSRKTTRALTKVMVLHPVGAALNFVAFGLALGASVLGSLAAALFAILAFIVTAVVMVCDFVLFAILRSDINDDGDGDSGSHARFSVGIWCVLASAIASLLGAVIMFASCCLAAVKKRKDRSKVHGNGHSNGHVEKRRRFWQRR